MSKLLLIDGNSIMNRGYFALPKTFTSKDGLHTNAILGFLNIFFKVAEEEKPTHVVVAFDMHAPTFRHKMYAEYKGTRHAMDDELREQFPVMKELLTEMGITYVEMEGWEADDIIGTFSRKGEEEGMQVTILSGDRDLLQLATDTVLVRIPKTKAGKTTVENYYAKDVVEEYGVTPIEFIEMKGLMGDTSDNIPGIMGIGEKTAVKLLSEFKTVDNVLANIDKVEGNSLKEKLQNGVEDAKMSKYLATIVQDVDVPFDFDKTQIDLPDISAVTEFLRSMQFYSFLKNIEYILKLFNKDGVVTVSVEQKTEATESVQGSLFAQNQPAESGQLGLFAQAVQAEVNKEEFLYNSKLITDSADFEQMLSVLGGKKYIGVNIFAQYDNAVDVNVYGIALACNDRYSFDNSVLVTDNKDIAEVYYIPLAHNIEKQLEKDYVVSKLSPLFSNSNIRKCVHDVKKHICALNELGIKNFNGAVFDTMLASYIYNSNANSAFDIQCMEQINHILPTIVSDSRKSSLADNDMTVMK